MRALFRAFVPFRRRMRQARVRNRPQPALRRCRHIRRDASSVFRAGDSGLPLKSSEFTRRAFRSGCARFSSIRPVPQAHASSPRLRPSADGIAALPTYSAGCFVRFPRRGQQSAAGGLRTRAPRGYTSCSGSAALSSMSSGGSSSSDSMPKWLKNASVVP